MRHIFIPPFVGVICFTLGTDLLTAFLAGFVTAVIAEAINRLRS